MHCKYLSYLCCAHQSCRVVSSLRAKHRVTRVPHKKMLKLLVAIHLLDMLDALCIATVHCITSHGSYCHVVLASRHELGYLHVMLKIFIHNCSVLAAQAMLHRLISPCSKACMQSAEMQLTGCICLQAPPVEATSSVDPTQGAARRGVRQAAA